MTRRSLSDLMRLAAAAIAIVIFQSSAQAVQPSSRAWDAYASEFIEATFKARPQFAVWAGRHEFDGQLPDFSEEGIRKEIKRLHEARTNALGFKDSALSDKQRFERQYVIAEIDGELFWLETAQWQ